MKSYKDIKYRNEVKGEQRNLIVYGAPGTGKSWSINSKVNNLFKSNELYRRITFYNQYSYSKFIGGYKPISICRDLGGINNIINSNGIRTNKEPLISYEFVPGVFLELVLKAINNSDNNYLMIIEEINRGDAASIFGDFFQILDRNEDYISEYRVSISTEMKSYIEITDIDDDKKQDIINNGIYLPSNLYIWATMNSADQGVYPMDSAFKRRWTFEYIGINKNEEQLEGKDYEVISLKNDKNGYSEYKWNTVRRAINDRLKEVKGINEDKFLGSFFLSKTELLKSRDNQEEFDEIFKSKVLMYLYEDILKHKKIDFFVEGANTLSDVMDAYDNGKVFNFEIEQFKKGETEDSLADSDQDTSEDSYEDNSKVVENQS